MGSTRCCTRGAGIGARRTGCRSSEATGPGGQDRRLRKIRSGSQARHVACRCQGGLGPGSKCAAKKCIWSTTPNVQRDLGARLSFVLNKGKVVAIIVQDGTGGAKAGIKKFRTAKNIGIGSTSAAVRKAYPALGPFSGSVGFGNANLGSGKTVTNFQFVNDKLDTFQIGSPI